MKWTEIAGREPALGTVLHDRLIKPGVVLVGTTRRDGSARISGTTTAIRTVPLLFRADPRMTAVRTRPRGPSRRSGRTG